MKHTIKRTAYQGYLWYSDEQIPKVFDNEEVELELDDTANPFIVEGQLYDMTEDRSISINFIDGKYIINTYSGKTRQFNDVSGEALTEGNIEQYAPSSRLNLGDKVLYFARIWVETEDVINDNWKTLCPSGLVFKGFGPLIKGGNND